MNSISWDPTGKFLASASDDDTVRIWDTNSGQQLRVLKKNEGGVSSISWSPTGKFIASSGVWDRTIIIWKIEYK